MIYLFSYVISTGCANAVYGSLIFSLFALIVYQWRKKRKLAIAGVRTTSCTLLMAFGGAYVLFGAFSIRGIEFYLVAPILCYLAGYMILYVNEQKERTVSLFLFSILLGLSTHALLNFIINVGRERWQLEDFFSGGIRAATGSGFLNTMALSLLAYFLLIEKRKLLKLLGTALFVIALLYAFLLGTRTQFVIFFVVSAVIVVLYLHESRSIKVRRRVLSALILLAVVIVVAYQRDFLNMRSTILDSNLFYRFTDSATEGSDEYRISSVLTGFINTLEHPFGGLSDLSYYHNMWLDVGRVGGLLPMLFLLLYSIVVFYHVVLLFCKKELSKNTRYLLLSIYIAVFINFFTEPVLEGMIDFFLMFCRVNGLVDALYYSLKNNTEEIKLQNAYCRT